MLCVPAVRIAVHVAAPAFNGCAEQPVIVFEPSRNVTVPVGEPVPGASTTTPAVNVSAWPTTGDVISEFNVTAVEGSGGGTGVGVGAGVGQLTNVIGMLAAIGVVFGLPASGVTVALKVNDVPGVAGVAGPFSTNAFGDVALGVDTVAIAVLLDVSAGVGAPAPTIMLPSASSPT